MRDRGLQWLIAFAAIAVPAGGFVWIEARHRAVESERAAGTAYPEATAAKESRVGHADPAGESAAGLAAHASTAPKAEAHLLTGVVVDGDGLPIVGARVLVAEALRGDPPDFRTSDDAPRTAADGSFAITPAIVSSAYRVVAWAPGLGADATDAARLGEPIRLVVNRGATLLGTVFGPEGLPIAYARVRWLAACRFAILVIETESDRRGEYRLEGIPVELDRRAGDGGGRIEVAADGFAAFRRAVPAYMGADADTVLDLEMGRGFTLKAHVIDDETEAPIPGADVFVSWGGDRGSQHVLGDVDDPFAGAPMARARSDEHGWVRMRGLPPAMGGYAPALRVAVLARGYETGSESLEGGLEGSTSAVVIRRESIVTDESEAWEPPASEERILSGTVLLPDGSPAAGAGIWLGWGRPSRGDPLQFSGADGTFRLTFEANHASGDLCASLPGYLLATFDRPGPDDAGEGLVLNLGSGRTVRGLVRTFDGIPRSGVPVFAVERNRSCGCGPPTTWGEARTALDGTFEIRGLPLGEGLRIEARSACWLEGPYDKGRLLSSRDLADGAERIDLVLPAPDPTDETQESRIVVVEVASPSGAGRWTGPLRADLTTEEGGEWRAAPEGFGTLRFASVSFGRSTLKVTGAGMRDLIASVDVVRGPGDQHVEVRPRIGNTIGGPVEGIDDLTPEDLQVRLHGAEGLLATRRVEGEGLRLEGVPPGRWRVEGSTVFGEDVVLESPVVLDVAEDRDLEVTWRFVRGVRVEARFLVPIPVVHEPDAPPPERPERPERPHVRVTILDAEGRVRCERTTGTSLSPEEGSDFDACLPPGEYRLVAEADGREPEERRFAVKPGTPVSLVLRLP